MPVGHLKFECPTGGNPVEYEISGQPENTNRKDDTKMETVSRIFNIVTSLVEITHETVRRIDIQEYKVGNCHGYVGYLYTNKNDYRIRKDGTFEIIKKDEILGIQENA